MVHPESNDRDDLTKLSPQQLNSHRYLPSVTTFSKALRYGLMAGVLGHAAVKVNAQETSPMLAASGASVAVKPAETVRMPTPTAKEVDMNAMQIKALLQKEYEAFSTNPTPAQGAILAQRIIDISVLDEAKSSPALLRAIAQETWNVARQSKSAEVHAMAIAFASTCRLGTPPETLFSNQERLLDGNAHIRLLNADGEHRMALTEIAAMEQENLETAPNIRKLRVSTLTMASSHPSMRTSHSAKIDLAALRLQYGQLYLQRYIESADHLRDEEDLATARKCTQLVQSLLQPYLNKTSSDPTEAKMIDDAKGISRELGVTNKAIISMSQKTPLDPEKHRNLGEFAFIEGRWEVALDHLRKGQSPFTRKYDPKIDQVTGKPIEIASGPDQLFQAGLRAWQDAKQMPDAALRGTMEKYAGYLFSEAKKQGLNGISLVTVNDVFSKNPQIEPAEAPPVQNAIPVIVASTTLKPATETIPTPPQVPANNEKPAASIQERKFAEQLLSIGAQVTISNGAESRTISAAKDLPQSDVSITGITISKARNLSWMPYLPSLKNLTTLKVSDCSAGDQEFAVLAHLPNLQVFSITNTMAGQQTLTLASKLPIKVLRIDGFKVNDATIANFADNKNLTYLNLSGTQLSDRALASLGTLENLGFISLSGNKQLSAAAIHAFLEKNKSIKTLELSGCSINDLATPMFELHPQITSLNLSGTPISSFCIAHLAKCQSLKSLNVSGTNLSAADKDQLQKKLPGCTVIK